VCKYASAAEFAMAKGVMGGYMHTKGSVTAWRAVGLGAAMLSVSLAASACGSSAGPKVSANGPVTITVATDTPDAVVLGIVSQFEKKYPDVKVKVEASGYNDFVAQEPLELASSNPPDVVLINSVANMAKDNLLLSLNSYAKKYGWYQQYSSTKLAESSVAANGTTLGGSNLVGLPLSYYEVGVYYNKALAAKAGITSMPTTLSGFEADLAQAKAKRLLPMQFGDEQGHASFTIQEIAQGISGAAAANAWVFGTPGQTFNTAANREGVDLLAQWEHDGYFPSATQVDGTNLAGAVTDFVKGQGVFFMDGNWDAPEISEDMGSNVGFFVFPGQHVAAAGGSSDFAIAAKSAHPAQAAEFLNFFNSPQAAKAVYAAGEMPNDVSGLSAQAGSLNADLLSVFQAVSAANGFTDAYANATSSMDNTFIAQTQELIAGRTTANSLVSAIQADWQTEHE
jgi:raffinose/stachyose/melibiose transport system substrate-binding protein